MNNTPKTAIPRHISLKKDQGLTLEWPNGRSSFYSVNYLRKWSPSADARKLREDMSKNPLTVLPDQFVSDGTPLTILNIEMVGHYAIKIYFSDSHDTGIYSWEY